MENKVPVTDNILSNQELDIHENEIDLSELFGVLMEGKWIIAIITGVFFIGSIFYAFIATPIYQADATLQIEKKSTGLSNLGLDSLLIDGGADASVFTEIEIIKSRNIIGKVVDKLNLAISAQPDYFPVIGAAIARRNQSSLSSGIGGYAWGGEKIQLNHLSLPNNLLKSGVTLLAGENQSYTLEDENGKQLLTGKVNKTGAGNGITIFVSELNAGTGVGFSLNQGSRIKIINILQKSIKVSERGKKTGILSIRLEGKNPILISRIVDTISNLYLRQNIERMSQEAKNGLQFLQNQLLLIKGQMQAAEIKLNNYRSSKSSVNLTLEAQSLLNKIIVLEANIAELEIKHSDLSKKYTDLHPIMLTLINQETKLKEQLKKVNIEAYGLPKTQQETLRLSRDVEVATTIYTQLLNKAQELKIAKAGVIGNVRIIDTALTTEHPIKPKKTLIALMGFLIGLILGVVAVFIRQAINSGVKNPDLIEKNIGIPVYANVPLSVKQKLLEKDLIADRIKHSILCEHDSKDQSIEGLRSLRTNLHFALLEAKNNIVMITSSAPNVGKSFISINFAHVIAQAGQKVLLIDADMRKGHIHKKYGMERGTGLSELIIGNVDKNLVVRNSSFENVDIITTGTLPPNPSELLMHENFEEILNQFSQEYDLVLIDTPPLLAVTDAAVVGRLCGTTFVLLRYDAHSMTEIRTVVRRLRQNNIDPKGFILNRIQLYKGYGKYANYHYEYK